MDDLIRIRCTDLQMEAIDGANPALMGAKGLAEVGHNIMAGSREAWLAFIPDCANFAGDWASFGFDSHEARLATALRALIRKIRKTL